MKQRSLILTLAGILALVTPSPILGETVVEAWPSPSAIERTAPADSADNSMDPRLEGSLAAGLPGSVAIAGDYAYCAAGYGLAAFDVTDPSQPVQTDFLPIQAYDVALTDGYALVAGASFLWVVDTSDPTQLRTVARWRPAVSPMAQFWDVAVSGNLVLAPDGTLGQLYVLDISDPAAPVQSGVCEGVNARSPADLSVSGSYVYAVGGGVLTIVSIADPTQPTKVVAYDPPGTPRCVAVSGGHAYLGESEGTLRVIDVSDPSAPVEVGSCDAGGYLYGVTVHDGYAYVASKWQGLRIFDISAPADPVQVGAADTPGQASQVAVSAGYAYVGDWDGGLRVMDISDPTSPHETGHFNTPATAADIAVSGNHAYIADESQGLRIIDISEPQTPVEVSTQDMSNAKGVEVAGDYAFVCDRGSGAVRVIDVVDPLTPEEVGYCRIPGAQKLVLDGDRAFVAAFTHGLYCLDISAPTAPIEVGWLDTPEAAYDVAVSGTHAYVADAQGGLRVINVSDYSAPYEVAVCNTCSCAMGVVISGQHAFVADMNENGGALRVIDISDPAQPVEVGFVDVAGYPLAIAVSEPYAYMTTKRSWSSGLGYAGLLVIDISDPTNPALVGKFSTAMEAPAVAASGGLVYFTSWGLGLFVLRLPALSDVPWAHWAADQIMACVDANIVAGYDDGLYHPDWPVTRDQMAVYISRALVRPSGDAGIPAPTPPPTFPDVPEDFWAYPHIEYCVEQNVVVGYDDGLYHPEYDVTRDQMAAFVARAMCGGDEYVPPCSEPPPGVVLPDVVGHWAERYICYLVDHGVVYGYNDGLYHPEIVVTRDQMAVYVARAFELGL